jgi:hypothetical protein
VKNLHASLYWSKHYGEYAIREASRRQLAERTRASREPRGLRHLGLACRNVLSSLRATSEPNDSPAVEPVE